MIRRIWRRFRPGTTDSPSVVQELPSSDDLLHEVLLRAPDAVKAQREMDKHPHAYHTNKVRLFELIDFNDAFVDWAMSLSEEQRRGCLERLKTDLTKYCKEQGSPMFTDEQYEAITRGLSREIAVFLGAKAEGFTVAMSSRTQDALGIDMTVQDPRTGRSVGIDCKAASAFRYRLKDLVSQGRLTEQEAKSADERGFVRQVNGHGRDAAEVTVLRVDQNEMGDLTDLTFDDTKLLAARLRRVLDSV